MRVKTVIILLSFITSLLMGGSSYYKDGVLVELDNLSNNRSFNKVNYFQTKEGIKMGTTDEIILKCKIDIDCKKLLRSFNIKSSRNLTNTILVLKVNDGANVFDISRKLFETGLVEYAHPNFIKKRKMR